MRQLSALAHVARHQAGRRIGASNVCGLFGWIGRGEGLAPQRRQRLAVALAALNDKRGGHSWGAACGSFARNGWQIARGLGDALPVSGWLGTAPIVMGHTRWATMGARTHANAHPFERGSIALAHNGVVYDALKAMACEADAMAVDSELLAARVARGDGFDDLSGYGVVTWIDKRTPRVIKLCHVGSGDIAAADLLGRGGHGVGVVYSSDRDHMIAALRASGVRWREQTLKRSRVYDLTEYGVRGTAQRLSWGQSAKRAERGLAAWLRDAHAAAAAGNERLRLRLDAEDRAASLATIVRLNRADLTRASAKAAAASTLASGTLASGTQARSDDAGCPVTDESGAPLRIVAT